MAGWEIVKWESARRCSKLENVYPTELYLTDHELRGGPDGKQSDWNAIGGSLELFIQQSSI